MANMHKNHHSFVSENENVHHVGHSHQIQKYYFFFFVTLIIGGILLAIVGLDSKGTLNQIEGIVISDNTQQILLLLGIIFIAISISLFVTTTFVLLIKLAVHSTHHQFGTEDRSNPNKKAH